MTKIALSMMSGTSLDGIDIICGVIQGNHTSTRVKILHAKTYAYQPKLMEKIKDAIRQKHSTSKHLCSLNFELAKAYSKCVFDFCRDYKIDMKTIDFIASHGQTIYHLPEAEDDFIASSLQLGDGSVLANLTNIPVVSNFRTADMAQGGQGAPLVPYANYVLFQSKDQDRILQNIGGIANATYLKKGGSLDQVLAFDNGPGNMMIDYAMMVLYGRSYDENGQIARSGKLINPMFHQVMRLPFFDKLPPKTTGRELFGQEFSQALLDTYQAHKAEDIICTLTHITAYAIVKSYQDFCPDFSDKTEIILSGGGAHNRMLVDLIKDYSQSKLVKTLDDYGYDVNYYEALAFLILGHESLSGNPSNVPSATGAKRQTILGQISPVIR